ncbi:hypothetical protein Tcan_18842 [Toxocara canis]|uniref:Uncharacterized protein n=1 Tax=Toxocara canis TaxID=6265 RepID=A0A0B2UTP2_TOXCA|nr:hypothetical protein Tcan_18842 [Toxocara canis]
MRLRQRFKETHSWSGPYKEQVIEKRYSELKKYVWRRIDPARRLGILRVRGHGIGRRGGSGGHGYTAHGALPQCRRSGVVFQVIEKRYSELKKYVWRRIDTARCLGILRVRGHGIGRRGGSGGHGYTAHGALPQCLLH